MDCLSSPTSIGSHALITKIATEDSAFLQLGGLSTTMWAAGVTLRKGLSEQIGFRKSYWGNFKV